MIPLLTTINGSYVIVGGTQLPLYYASPGQINAQLPVELPLNRPQTVIVASGGGFTLPDTLNITAVSPGVAAISAGAIIAQHSHADGYAGGCGTSSSPERSADHLSGRHGCNESVHADGPADHGIRMSRSTCSRR